MNIAVARSRIGHNMFTTLYLGWRIDGARVRLSLYVFALGVGCDSHMFGTSVGVSAHEDESELQ